MQPEQIMSSDLLDILFADRNKLYGAYPLRKGYNRRLSTALCITGAMVVISLVVYYMVNKPQEYYRTATVIIDSLIPERFDKPKPPDPPAAPRLPKPMRRVESRQYVTLVVEPDNQVKHTIPPVDDLNNAQIDLKDQTGIPDAGLPLPPAVNNNIISATTVHEDNANKIIEKAEIESSYPGGPNAWKRFLIKTFRYPSIAEENQISGMVLVKFVVDKQGNVSNIQVLSGPQELRSEAIRVISKSGKWIPAMQNGTVVNSYKYQQIVFRLNE
jgi:protein TonB